MPDIFDAILDQQSRLIAAHGWAVTGVLPDPGEVAYAYTVGLTAINAPELVITGLDYVVAQFLLNDAARRVRDQEMIWCPLVRASGRSSGAQPNWGRTGPGYLSQWWPSRSPWTGYGTRGCARRDDRQGPCPWRHRRTRLCRLG